MTDLTVVEEPRKRGITFNLSINLGHLLTIGTLLITMGAAYSTYAVTVHSHDMRLRFLEAQVQSLVHVNNELTANMYTLRQDVAVIRDRVERMPYR